MKTTLKLRIFSIAEPSFADSEKLVGQDLDFEAGDAIHHPTGLMGVGRIQERDDVQDSNVELQVAMIVELKT